MSPERMEELRLREDAARSALSAETFEALQSLVGAEMRRIHRLYYCILLRCMAMPTRFLVLTELDQEPSGAPRQPVPAQFEQKGEMDGEEYFEWLYKEVAELREPFIEQISRAVRNFNDATWPKDLGLAKKK